MKTSGSVWVIVPAYNEESVIEATLDDLKKFNANTVVVDDASTDATGKILEKISVHYLRHPVNLGQGAAIQTGITYALSLGAEILVTFDADGQHRAEDIEALIAPILKAEADVTLGTRFGQSGQAIALPASRKALLKLGVLFTRMTTGLNLTDTHNGLRAFRAAAAAKLCITQNGMAHASQLLAQIAELQLNYREVPVSVIYTEYSLAKGQKLSNAFNILWETFVEFWKLKR